MRPIILRSLVAEATPCQPHINKAGTCSGLMQIVTCTYKYVYFLMNECRYANMWIFVVHTSNYTYMLLRATA